MQMYSSPTGVQMLEVRIPKDQTIIVQIGLKSKWTEVGIRPMSKLLKSEQPVIRPDCTPIGTVGQIPLVRKWC
jgi:hypothetical protein